MSKRSRRQLRRDAVTTAALLLALGLGQGFVEAADSVGRPTRHAERPPAQRGAAGSLSSISIIRFFPAGLNHIEFDYVVDSEPNDRLELLAVGFSSSPIWAASGLNLGGRAKVPFTLPNPTAITVRFQYVKNNDDVHGGTDTAWVNRIRFVSRSAGVFYSAHFGTETIDETPPGWMGAGFAGGWVVRPPAVARSAVRPPQQQDNQKSHMERVEVFPVANGAVDFDYYVDSEAGHDFLRFLLDDVEIDLEPDISGVQGVSGRHRHGHLSVPVPTPGAHTLRFEYVKDGSGSEGLDVARVDHIRIRRAPSVLENFHDFNDRAGAPGGIGHAAGGPVEWTGDWVAARSTPHRTYLPQQQPGQKWAANWSTFSQPQLDGLVTSEYKNPVLIKLPDFSSGAAANAGARLVLVGGDGLIHLGLRVPSTTAAPGGEQGRLQLFLDDRHLATMNGAGGCGNGSDLPDSSDRRIDLTYSFSQPTTLTPAQERGTCLSGNAWEAVSAAHPAWPVEVAISEPPDDPGFVHLEIRIALPPSVTAEDAVGLALIRENLGPSPALERYPYLDDGVGPLFDSVSSWESLLFDYQPGRPRPTEQAWDLGAFPQPSLPHVHW